jgi:hypothetical protein
MAQSEGSTMIIASAALATSAMLSITTPVLSAQSAAPGPVPTGTVAQAAGIAGTITSASCLGLPTRELPGPGVVAATLTDASAVAMPTIRSCLAAPKRLTLHA